MDNTLLTVCIVTYNQNKYIKACLDSIVNQKTKCQFQVIISDDASTDGTSEICETYAREYSFVSHVRHEKNIGAYENFKYVHRQAKSKYVSHCDGDDYWAEDKIEAQIDFLEKNIDCSAVYSNAIVVNEDGSAFGLFNNADRIPSKISIGYLLAKSNFLNNSSMVYRRDIIGNVFYSSEKVVDYRVHINLASFGLLGYIRNPLAYYRKGADGGLCSTVPSAVGQLVHAARLEGIKNSKLNIFECSEIKANALYGKFTSVLKRNRFVYAQHVEVESLIMKYSFISTLLFFTSEVFNYLFNTVKNKLYKNDNTLTIFCRR